MPRDASVTFDWADGTYTFRLGIGQLRELQEKCDAGPALILRRLTDETWRVDEVSNTIRLGLIGGGVKPEAALKLVRNYVEVGAWFESVMPAQAILMAALTGSPDEPLGKATGETAAASLSQERSSVLPPSMERPD